MEKFVFITCDDENIALFYHNTSKRLDLKTVAYACMKIGLAFHDIMYVTQNEFQYYVYSPVYMTGNDIERMEKLAKEWKEKATFSEIADLHSKLGLPMCE